jgi:hypothetical protein
MIDPEMAMNDPGSVFSGPSEVVNDPTLTRRQKIDILRSWAYDERELSVAEEENMLSTSDEPNDLLSEILNCLHSLGVEGDQKDPPPTKQG